MEVPPHEYPVWSTVYDYFRKWRNAGVWEGMVRTLRESVDQDNRSVYSLPTY